MYIVFHNHNTTTITKRLTYMKGAKDLEKENFKLFLENCQIIQENEKLRRRAQQLKENQARLTELKQKLSDLSCVEKAELGLQLGSRSQKEEKASKIAS